MDYIRPQKGQKGKKCKARSFRQFHATLRAGLFDRLDARLIIPVLHKKMERQSFNQDFSDDQTGVGDVKLISRYRILSQKRKDPFNLAFGAGLKFPTGVTDEEDGTGTCLPGYLQPGSGSWDPVFELGAHKVMGRHWFSTYFMYQLTTEGELGDRDWP